MKNITYLFFFLGVIFYSQGQNVSHVFKWQAQTLSGGSFVGISSSKKNALLEIEQLMQNASGSKDIIDFEIHFATISQSSSHSIFEEFVNLTPDKANYVFLNAQELEALYIFKKKGIHKSTKYYEDVTHFSDKNSMLLHLKSDVLVFEKFLFFEQKQKPDRTNIYSAH